MESENTFQNDDSAMNQGEDPRKTPKPGKAGQQQNVTSANPEEDEEDIEE